MDRNESRVSLVILYTKNLCLFVSLWIYDGKNRKTTVATVILITYLDSQLTQGTERAMLEHFRWNIYGEINKSSFTI